MAVREHFLVFQGEEIITGADTIEEAKEEFDKIMKPKDGRFSTKRSIYKLVQED